MITEKGSIRVETQVDLNVQKELSKKFYVVGIIALSIGCVGVAAFLTIDILSAFNILPEPNILILVAVATVFAFGLVLIATFRKLFKTAGNAPVRTAVCEFYADCIIGEDILNGEKVGAAKILYGQIVNRKETVSYLFFYLNAAVATPVLKNGLTTEELNTLRALIGLGAKGETVKLPNFEETVTGAMEEGENQ